MSARLRLRTSVPSVAAGVVLALGGAAAPAAAAAAPDFGRHVSDCAQERHLGGAHHPGLHRGAAGWDGTPCHEHA